MHYGEIHARPPHKVSGRKSVRHLGEVSPRHPSNVSAYFDCSLRPVSKSVKNRFLLRDSFGLTALKCELALHRLVSAVVFDGSCEKKAILGHERHAKIRVAPNRANTGCQALSRPGLLRGQKPTTPHNTLHPIQNLLSP